MADIVNMYKRRNILQLSISILALSMIATLLGSSAELAAQTGGTDPFDSFEQPASLVLMARGSTGDEVLDVLLEDEITESVALTTDWVEYEFEVPAATTVNAIKIAFNNDSYDPPYDRNLQVDWIELEDRRFETEAASTFSRGSWTSSNGCGPGNKETDTLHCNGYFQYAEPTTQPPTTQPPTCLLYTSDAADE